MAGSQPQLLDYKLLTIADVLRSRSSSSTAIRSGTPHGAKGPSRL
jgi:hypothetical protein